MAIPAGGIQLLLEIIPSKQHKSVSDSSLMMKQYVSGYNKLPTLLSHKSGY
ncbi:MAG: hypothetical protein WBP64_11215 [Nitrososphaeraceae archaeon]